MRNGRFNRNIVLLLAWAAWMGAPVAPSAAEGPLGPSAKRNASETPRQGPASATRRDRPAPATPREGPTSETPAPKVEVRLLADRTAVVPGGSVEVGLAFRIPKEWHIYWRYPGDSGKPPEVEWHLPPGARVSPLRFPVPRRHVERGGLVTYVLEDEPVLLATVDVPEQARAGTTFRIEADVVWLVCKEQCVLQSRRLSLELPVVAEASRVEPANADVFEAARYALPKPASQAQYARISASFDRRSIGPREEGTVVLTVALKPHMHAQSNTPAEGFIPTEVFVDPPPGVEVVDIRYPPARVREDRYLGRLSEYVGTIRIEIPIRTWRGVTPDDNLFEGVLVYQVCDERTGQCFAPEALEWSVALPIRTDTVAQSFGEDSVAAPAAQVPGEGTPPGARSAQPGTSAEDKRAIPPQASGTTGAASQGVAAEGGRGTPARSEGTARVGLWGMLLGGFLGGLILNIMPCVLPVISIKVLSFVQQAGESRARVVRLGLTFALGILVSFWVLGAVVIGVRAAGGGFAWGSQMQSPVFVIVMASVMFVFALMLFGVFTLSLPGRAMTAMSAAEAREGYAGAFAKGVLATVLATPCTAPFLGAAAGYAFVQPPASVMAFMTAVGAGLAFPYLVLTVVPQWLRFLPRPGPWMERFKQFTGFLLLATVVWLLWILGRLAGVDALVATLAFLCVLGLACWLIGQVGPGTPALRGWFVHAAAVALVLIGADVIFRRAVDLDAAMAATAGAADPRRPDGAGGIVWRAWEPGLPERLAAEGYTVYVDFTADWCLTCKTNKKVALETREVEDAFRRLGVVALKADFTRPNAAIQRELRRFGRAGVPLNVIYPAGRPDEVIVLPEVLTPSVVLSRLREAGPSRAPAGEPLAGKGPG